MQQIGVIAQLSYGHGKPGAVTRRLRMAQSISTFLVMVTTDVQITQRGCGFFAPEENHEETEQSGNVDCLRSARNRRRRTNRRQLEERHQRAGLEERHQRTVLA